MLKKNSPAVATFVAFAALCALVFAPLAARAEGKRPDVEELLAVLHMEQNLQAALGQVEKFLPQITANVAAQTGAAPTRELQNRLRELIKKTTSWENLRPEVVAIYADAYSKEDVEALLAFYKSKAGQALLKKEPEVARKVAALQQKKFGELLPAIEKILAEELKTKPADTSANAQ